MNENIGHNKERESNDFYATNPNSIKDIIRLENLNNLNILENSAGMGHIVKELEKANNKVFTIDIINRGFKLDRQQDFLKFNENLKFDCAVYNPPFKYLKEFVLHTFNFTNYQIVFSRLQILESETRFDELFSKGYLKKVYVYSKRTNCFKEDKDIYYKNNGSIAFCWLIFDKNYKGKTEIEWICNKKLFK